MTTTTTVAVKIPGPMASRSKMARKGWKCWAKRLSSVAKPASDGYAYEGEFIGVGTTIETEAGDVILHVDQSGSAGIGVVCVRACEGFISWLDTADASGRNWCGALGATTRKLLAMSADERRVFAGEEPAAKGFDAASLAAQVRQILDGLSADQVAEVLALAAAEQAGAQ